MEITEIHFRFLNKGKMRAYVNVIFDNEFAVKGMKKIETKSGKLLLLMPQKKQGDIMHDVVFPINKQFREKLEKRILEEYALAKP